MGPGRGSKNSPGSKSLVLGEIVADVLGMVITQETLGIRLFFSQGYLDEQITWVEQMYSSVSRRSDRLI